MYAGPARHLGLALDARHLLQLGEDRRALCDRSRLASDIVEQLERGLSISCRNTASSRKLGTLYVLSMFLMPRFEIPS